MRTVYPLDAQFLLDEQRRKSGAVDEQISFQALTASGLYGGDVAVLRQLDLDRVIEVVCYAARRRQLAQIVGKFQRIHVVGVGQWPPEVPGSQHLGRQPELTDDRLCRNSLAEWNGTIAHQPMFARPVDRARSIAAERMVVVFALAVQPIDVFDGLLEGAVDPPHELVLVDADHGQNMIDIGNGRLANADARYIG